MLIFCLELCSLIEKMNCFCTVSQWMLKEYVLHRSILFLGGGLFVHICDQVTQHRDRGFKWREVYHCFFCLKKRLYAVKSFASPFSVVMCGEAA